MNPDQAMQILDQLGIRMSDLPIILQAAQAVASAQGERGQQHGTPTPGNQGPLAGSPGATNPIPNKPATPAPADEEAMMNEVFASDRRNRNGMGRG